MNSGRVDVTGGPVEDIDIDDDAGWRVNHHGDLIDAHGNSGEFAAFVPLDTAVDIHANTAEVNVLGVRSVVVHLNHGELDIADVTERVKINANAGDIVLDNVGGPIEIQANRGDVFIRLPRGRTVDADLRTERGDVANTCARGGDVKIKVRLNRGDITVEEEIEPDR